VKKHTRKIWKRSDKLIPGVSNIIDPIKSLGLNKKQEGLAELASSMYLAYEKSHEKESGKRITFSESTKRKVLENQKGKCKLCKKKIEVRDFDHIDGNSSNNDISNCQALCPNCHAKKTRKKKLDKL